MTLRLMIAWVAMVTLMTGVLGAAQDRPSPLRVSGGPLGADLPRLSYDVVDGLLDLEWQRAGGLPFPL